MTRRPDPQPSAAEAFDEFSSPLDVITRWELFGGTWRVVARMGDQVTMSLCRCDGGEEQQRLTSADPAFINWLDGKTSTSPEDPPQ